MEAFKRQRDRSLDRVSKWLWPRLKKNPEKTAKKAGFEVYADTIRLAEKKLSHAGVVMTDGEKKEKFYAGFNPRNSEW